LIAECWEEGQEGKSKWRKERGEVGVVSSLRMFIACRAKLVATNTPNSIAGGLNGIMDIKQQCCYHKVIREAAAA
jgi:hypothetical protein